MADDKKTQLGAGPSRAPSAPSLAPKTSTAEPLTPLATPPPSAVAALATQPSQAFAVPTNVPTAAMSAYPEDNLVGKTVAGRYSISKKLGEGGMGSVYLATHVVLEKQVALKVLHGEYARKPDLVERFMQEAKAASRIRHENVIDISDFGVTEDGLVFFAMELLKGSDLHELVARARLDGQVLPWDRTRHIFLQICAALSAAHSHGIVHRDLKPENVFLIEFLGRPDFVKLLDFGIAKLADNDGGERKLTRTGMLFGTPEYMSPEQARGDKADHRVDIYAMACILFQLLTGHVPFQADNFMGVLSLHLTEPPPVIPPATLALSGAPPELTDIVARGLCKNREERWQSIDEMAQAIRALDGEIDDHPAAPVELSRGRVRTQWTGTPRVPVAEGEAVPAAEAPRAGAGNKKAFAAVAAVVVVAGVGIGLWLARRPAPAGPAVPAEPALAATSPSPAPSLPETPATPTPAAPKEPTSTAPAVEPAAVPPAPLPEKVKITFVLPRGVTLYDAADKALGKGKTVELELAGSDAAQVYFARGKGLREQRFDVTPDRDDRIEVTLERESDARRSSTEKPPTTPTTEPGPSTPTPPTEPVTEPDDPGDPVIKDPFKSGKASGESAAGTP